MREPLPLEFALKYSLLSSKNLMLFAYKVQVLALISTTLPSSLITETPESVATAIVGTGRSVSGLIGALGRTVMATSLHFRLISPIAANRMKLALTSEAFATTFLVATFE